MSHTNMAGRIVKSEKQAKYNDDPKNVVPGTGHHTSSFWRVQLTRPNMEGIEAVIVLAQDPSICKAPSPLQRRRQKGERSSRHVLRRSNMLL